MIGSVAAMKDQELMALLVRATRKIKIMRRTKIKIKKNLRCTSQEPLQ